MSLDPAHGHHRTGVAIVVGGVLVLSFDALLIRLAGATAWDVAFWRGAFMALSLFLFLVIRRQTGSMRLFVSFGLPAFSSAILQGVGSLLFVLAVSNTSVANTVVLIATAPLFAAVASHFLLREHVALRTWAACVLVAVGVALVFRSALDLSQTAGNLYALGGAMTMGGSLTILRRHPGLPRIPLVALSGLITALLALPLSMPLQLSVQSYAVLALMGMLQMPLALVLITSGTRYLPSPEVSLFILLETLFGPLWVWMLLDESISRATLTGGAIIVATLLLHGWGSLREVQLARKRHSDGI